MLNEIKLIIASPLFLYVVLGLILLTVLGILVYTKKIKVVEKLLLDLVDQAEVKYGAGTGAIKYDVVVGWLYSQIPASTRFILNPIVLDKMIEYAVTLMKRKLSEDIAKQDVIDASKATVTDGTLAQ